MAPKSAQLASSVFSTRYSCAASRYSLTSQVALATAGTVVSTSHSAVYWQRPTDTGLDRDRRRSIFRSMADPTRWNSKVCNKVPLYHSFHTATYSVLLSPSRAARTKLMTAEGSRDFIDSLNSHQRQQLQAALKELQEEEEAEMRDGGSAERRLGVKETEVETKVEVTPPTWLQLRLLCYQQALPFLGFGFLDNFVMITVGEYIDISIGATLTISTMAAAGLGNLISDLAGLGLADRVEALCRLIGIPNPHMSSAQLHYAASRWMGLLGRCLGITIGCLVGMLPLLWFDHPRKKDKEEKETSNN